MIYIYIYIVTPKNGNLERVQILKLFSALKLSYHTMSYHISTIYHILYHIICHIIFHIISLIVSSQTYAHGVSPTKIDVMNCLTWSMAMVWYDCDVVRNIIIPCSFWVNSQVRPKTPLFADSRQDLPSTRPGRAARWGLTLEICSWFLNVLMEFDQQSIYSLS